ncbi:MAG TPA: hypothetical protein VKJ47_18580 [Candidatus Binatia bacterium]|nr:hypothetical protein [Candidatus Binatia bacterium]
MLRKTLAAAVVVVFLLPVVIINLPRSRINAVNCAKIKRGMTEQEVERLLGAPAGDLTGKGRVFLTGGETRALYPRSDFKYWMDDDGVIEVRFDQYGKVEEAWFGRTYEPSLFEEARSYLRKVVP